VKARKRKRNDLSVLSVVPGLYPGGASKLAKDANTDPFRKKRKKAKAKPRKRKANRAPKKRKANKKRVAPLRRTVKAKANRKPIKRKRAARRSNPAKIYKRKYAGYTLQIMADFSRASSPIRYRTSNSDGWDSTPFQVASFRHNSSAALAGVHKWLGSQYG
jgi:hypothetical protein